MKKIPRDPRLSMACFLWHVSAVGGVGDDGVVRFTAWDVREAFCVSKPTAIKLMKKWQSEGHCSMHSIQYRSNSIMWFGYAEFYPSSYSYYESMARLMFPKWFTPVMI